MSKSHDTIFAAYGAGETVRLADGRLCSGPNCEGDAARLLIDCGADPTSPITFLRDGVPSLCGSLRAFARRGWRGADRDPAFMHWRPYRRGNAPRAGGVASQDGAEGFGGINTPAEGIGLSGGGA